MFEKILNAFLNLVRGPASLTEMSNTLDDLANLQSSHLDWRNSIVDLLKLLNLDSSNDARARLAIELGYDGHAADGSAEKNNWLHRAVMAKVADHTIKIGKA